MLKFLIIDLAFKVAVKFHLGWLIIDYYLVPLTHLSLGRLFWEVSGAGFFITQQQPAPVFLFNCSPIFATLPKKKKNLHGK